MPINIQVQVWITVGEMGAGSPYCLYRVCDGALFTGHQTYGSWKGAGCVSSFLVLEFSQSLSEVSEGIRGAHFISPDGL